MPEASSARSRSAQGVVFGALIAATDPIAVVGLFRSLGAPARLRAVVDGESLLNDGTSLVLFTLALGYAAGRPLSAAGVALDFARIVGTGLGVGVLVGLAVSKIIQQVDDPMIEITLTTIAAYGSFVASETVHGSGVLATVAAGMLCGSYGARTGMSPTTRVATETFWEYVAFALNSVVFLLIGFEIHVRDLLGSWKVILAAWAAVLVARGLVVAAVSDRPARDARERLPWRWSAVIGWAGLRGALSMVLVVGLARSFPGRDLLVTMTFGVVLLTLLVQGLTMSPLLRVLGLAKESGGRAAYELERGRLSAVHAALAQLEEIRASREAHAKTLDALGGEYAARSAEIEERMTRLFQGREQLQAEELNAVARHLLQAEKDAAMEALRKDAIGRGSLPDAPRGAGREAPEARRAVRGRGALTRAGGPRAGESRALHLEPPDDLALSQEPEQPSLLDDGDLPDSPLEQRAVRLGRRLVGRDGAEPVRRGHDLADRRRRPTSRAARAGRPRARQSPRARRRRRPRRNARPSRAGGRRRECSAPCRRPPGARPAA